MGLFEQSGGTEQDRIAEARKLLARLEPETDRMSSRERDFIEQLSGNVELGCSPKQVFWLRDLADKYDV